MQALLNKEGSTPTQSFFISTGDDHKVRKSLLSRLAGFTGYRKQKHPCRDRHLPIDAHLLQDIGKTRMDVEFEV